MTNPQKASPTTATPSPAPPALELIPGGTLITPTPEAGRALAILLARMTVHATQPDVAVLQRLRPTYAQDPADLIAITHVVAIEFATIAAANGYWRPVPTEEPSR